MLHGRTEIAGFSLELYKSLQLEARKTHLIQHKINEMAVVQGELLQVGSIHGGSVNVLALLLHYQTQMHKALKTIHTKG